MGSGKIKDQLREFLSLIELHKEQGKKMRQMAAILELHPPVLSSITKTVFPAILDNKGGFADEKELIRESFRLVNNLSKEKVLYHLPTYIEKLKNVKIDEKEYNLDHDLFKPYKNAIASSHEAIARNFTGLYKCYTRSSNADLIKEEPMLIRYNDEKKYIEVKKGNTLSQCSFEGFIFLAGSHLISIHLLDDPDNIQESGLIQLVQPFVKSVKLLRGIYLNLSYSKQPLARRIILQKTKDDCSLENFETIATHYYEKTNYSEDINKEIIDYVSGSNDAIECLALPHPTFDEKDLVNEKRMIENMKSNIV